ncbi:eCIS core domain-containing protein [Streptomyces sp. NPDC003006]
MHDHQNVRGAGTGSGRTPAHSPSPAPPHDPHGPQGPHDPHGLLSLQATAGNAAVVQLLRQAGHQQDEQPAVQRSAVHAVLRTAGRPLDDATRTDMESRLGADFSDVRIHNDTAARASAAEVGARAYTSGSHIVIGQGGDDAHTLAHELTHVIQQRQGPVAGTDSGDGLRISDPADRYEREAETNATRVMSASANVLASVPASVSASVSASVPASVSVSAPERRSPSPSGDVGTVQRAVAAQVDSVDGEAVSEIHFAGRPKSPYSNTMGDHSTAFVVQQEAVKRAVVNRSPQQAAANLQELARKTLDLPGAKAIGDLPEDKRAECQSAYAALEATIASLLAGNDSPARQFPLVQKMVGEFLHFRELIPFTTMNVAAVSQGAAGKGKAEAGSNQVLSAAFSGNASNPEAVKEAIWKLMDRDGVAIVATEHDPAVLARLAPGMNPDLPPAARAETIIGQHLMSVEMAYPGGIASVLGSQEAAVTAFNTEIGPVIEGRRQENRYFYLDRLASSTQNIEGLYARGAHNDKHSSGTLKTECDTWSQLARALEFNGGKVPPVPQPPAPTQGRVSRSTAKLSATMTDLAEMMEAATLGGAAGPTSSSRTGSSAQATPQGNAAQPEQDSERQYLTSQIEVEGGRISALHSEGRSPSPFSSTMGAHTTAWIAHMDSIRKGLIGRTLDEAAYFIVTHAFNEAQHMESTVGQAFRPADDDQGRHQLQRLATAKADFQALAAALGNVSRAASQGDEISMRRQPLVLQKAINALLTYINYIPGATLESADTGGKGEGTVRKDLRKHEDGSVPLQRGYLQAYLMKLLDVPGEATESQLVALVENHLRIVGTAYPRSVGDAHLTQSRALEIARSAAQEKG